MKNKFKIVNLTKTEYPVKKKIKLGVCIFLTFFILVTTNKLVNSPIIPNFLSIFIFPLFFYMVYHVWKFYLLSERKRKNSIENLLKYYIKTNNLYTTDRTGFITNFAIFSFLQDDESITVRAYKQGDNFSDRLNTLDTSLSALLNLPLENKLDNISYCDYIFNKNKDNRIVIADDKLIYNYSTNIPLSNNLNWNIAKQPHLLLAGVTGGGKTTFINYLIIEMMKMKADVYICDPKRSDLASLKNILGSDYVASDVNNIAKLTRVVKEIMENRFIEYKENASNLVYGHSFVDYHLTPVFLIMDELGAFRAGADKKVFNETMSNLSEIILKGREMGVFCVLSTQQPNSQNIPTELRDNLSVRLALGKMSSEAYRMIFGEDIKGLQSISSVGSGYIYLDGLGWCKPKFYEAPFLDYKNYNFIQNLSKYQESRI
ncbi:FtsK/SpoIIIE domain-containing protein [Terrisporobacter petrolearius]|uniref:FtsK/SpoIIIE domain-containing protein n=1 Tax=Terrisporobacter petrolearius TaxID=1460447 RepID=UPI0022E04150|nr:FtsK/SpoIIIE domain-containing protein [Terrisporobacter petrolearius]